MRDDVDKLVAVCAQMLRGDENIEGVLLFLRRNCKNKIASIEVVARLLNISLGEAKLLVHTSETWLDVRERDEAFHQTVATALEQLAKKQDE